MHCLQRRSIFIFRSSLTSTSHTVDVSLVNNVLRDLMTFSHNCRLLLQFQTYYDDGDYIVRQGAVGDTMYIIQKGKVNHRKNSGMGCLWVLAYFSFFSSLAVYRSIGDFSQFILFMPICGCF